MFEALTESVAQGEATLAELEAQADATKARMRGFGDVADRAAAAHKVFLSNALDGNLASLHDAARVAYDPSEQAWEAKNFQDWKVATTSNPEEIRVGAFREQRSSELLPVSWNFPLVGSQRTIVIRSRGEDQYAAGLALLQSLIVRTSTMFPQQAKYTLLDPAGNGLAFPMSRHLSRVTPSSGDVRRDLDAVVQEITRIVGTYLDAGTTSFEQIPDEMRLNEAFHFVCLADFPNRYDLRAAEALQNIAETGNRAGVYVLMHLNYDRWDESTTGFERYLPSNSFIVDVGDLSIQAEGLSGSLELDTAPSAELQEFIFNRIKAAPPLDRPIPWDELVDTSAEAMWAESADELITATVGRHGANQALDVWFGYQEREMRPCVHGVLGAMSGSGKSTFFHNLINSLAFRYSPTDLRMYLIDGKFGVEFRPYQELPHAEVVSLRTSPDLSRSVLTELSDEMAARNEMFQRHGVVDITAYRKLGSPSGDMSRILLVVDEYQQLFDGDRDALASRLLKRISEQGRSSGIHMLLASQRFESSGMIERDAIFNNIHLRIAMQLAQSESASLTDFGPKGRRLIAATCDRVGRVVINDRAGDDESNVPGKTALLDAERRDELVARLIERAAALPPEALPRRVVFNGRAQPDFVDNPFVRLLASHDDWQSPDDLEAFARRDAADFGLGVGDWLAAERPLIMFFGQEFNVRGHASAVLRRRPNENLLVVGERNQERIAMLGSAMASVALTEAAGTVEFRIGDRSVPRTAWADTLSDVAAHLRRAGHTAMCERDDVGVARIITETYALLEQRLQTPEAERIDASSVLVMLSEPDRVASLLRIPDDYGAVDSELGQTLRQIVGQGPSVGIHVVLSSASLGVLKSVVSEKAIQTDFRHRVAMQMSEDDSFEFVRSNRACQLQIDGERPVCAIVFDSQRQHDVRFKPYSIEPPPKEITTLARPSFVEQVGECVARRPTNVGEVV